MATLLAQDVTVKQSELDWKLAHSAKGSTDMLCNSCCGRWSDHDICFGIQGLAELSVAFCDAFQPVHLDVAACLIPVCLQFVIDRFRFPHLIINPWFLIISFHASILCSLLNTFSQFLLWQGEVSKNLWVSKRCLERLGLRFGLRETIQN